ncbi:hypothetical protein D9M71_448090 [compost metagenome]
MSGQQVVQGHAHCIQVLTRAGRVAIECFRGDVRGRAGQLVQRVFGQARAISQAEVQQAQLAIAAQVQVIWLDIAVQQVAPMQHTDCLQQLPGDFQPLRQG